MTGQRGSGGDTRRRRDRLIQEERHDTYRSRGKLPEPSRCPGCEAVFERGRWSWARTAPVEPHEELCPACRRMRDSYPAGYVSISGSFLDEHRDEIINLVRNEAKRESALHPLKRIMDVETTDEGLLVTTTDSHLARSIGAALEQAYQGELDYRYTRADEMLRVAWKRDL